VLSDGTDDDTALFIIGNAIDANEHNAAVVKSLPIDEFAKILVFGDQDPCVLHGCFKDDVVASSLKFLSHPPDIMAVATDGTNGRSRPRPRRRGISCRLPIAYGVNCLMPHGLSCILKRGQNSFTGEPWMRLENLLDRFAAGEFSQSHFHSDASSPNDRLSEHQIRIGLDQLVCHVAVDSGGFRVGCICALLRQVSWIVGTKSRTASTCFLVTPGHHSTNSSTAPPFSRFSEGARTGNRVLAKTQAPLTLAGSRSTAVHWSHEFMDHF